jgi:hypothetical protein
MECSARGGSEDRQHTCNNYNCQFEFSQRRIDTIHSRFKERKKIQYIGILVLIRIILRIWENNLPLRRDHGAPPTSSSSPAPANWTNLGLGSCLEAHRKTERQYKKLKSPLPAAWQAGILTTILQRPDALSDSFILLILYFSHREMSSRIQTVLATTLYWPNPAVMHLLRYIYVWLFILFNFFM